MGIITAIGSSSVTVESANGKSLTFGTTSSTAYVEGGHSIARSALRVGDPARVMAKGTGAGSSSSHATASSVDIVRSHISGIVDHVGTTTITMTDFQGFQRAIATSSSTRYVKGTSSTSRTSVTAGQVVVAIGTVSGGTTLEATSVIIGAPGLPPGPPPGAPPGGPHPPGSHSGSAAGTAA